MVLGGAARAHTQQLQRRFDHGHGGLELVCGVGDEGALLHERALEPLQHALDGVGQRSQFAGGAGAGGRIELP